MNNLAAVEEERRLVAAARSGRNEAFTELVKLHQPQQLRLAMSLVRNREDAEEVVQEALLSAWRNITGFRGDAGFRTWLSRITWNFGMMALRRRKCRRLASNAPESLDVYPESSGIRGAPTNPEQRAIDGELTARVHRLLRTLPGPRRDLLELWIFEEMNMAEIARELNLTVPIVKVRLCRARQEVRRRLRKSAVNSRW